MNLEANHLAKSVTRIRTFAIKYLNKDAIEMGERIMNAGDKKFAEVEGLQNFIDEWNEDFAISGAESKFNLAEYKTAEDAKNALLANCKFRLGQPTATYFVACMEVGLEQLLGSALKNMLTSKQHYFRVSNIVNNEVLLNCNSAGLFRDLPTWKNAEFEKASRDAHELVQQMNKAVHKEKVKACELAKKLYEANGKKGTKPKDEKEFQAEEWKDDSLVKIPHVGPSDIMLGTGIDRVWKAVLKTVDNAGGQISFTKEARAFVQSLMVDLINRLTLYVRHIASQSERKTISKAHFAAAIAAVMESTSGKSFELLNAGDKACEIAKTAPAETKAETPAKVAEVPAETKAVEVPTKAETPAKAEASADKPKKKKDKKPVA